MRGSESLAGWCYTQLTDTAQETNGLTDERRVPKIAAERIRALVEGVSRGRPAEPAFGQPGVPSETGAGHPVPGSVGP